VADQLYLSYKLQSPTGQQILRGYEKLLRTFPTSKLSKAPSTLRMIAVQMGEPPLYEESFDAPADIESVLAGLREFAAADVAYFFETAWDLWQFEAKEDWKLMPTRVVLAGFGPAFESGREDDLRIEFGIDTHFLPQPDLPNHVYMAQSNIRSLLHLVHELDAAFATAVRTLWTETGENFAQRLQEALEESAREQ